MEPEEKKSSNKLLIAAIIIVAILIAICGTIIYYINTIQLKLYIDGEDRTSILDYFDIDSDGKVYVSISDIASILKYEYVIGEYKVFSDNKESCHVKNEYESTSLFLNSKEILKCNIGSGYSSEYESYEISEPVKMINNKLYVISDGMQLAFNVKFSYDKTKNQMVIQTLPYLQTEIQKRLGKTYTLSTNFYNQKAILYNLYVVTKGTGTSKLGVIKSENGSYTDVLGQRYTDILFLENKKEFKIIADGKVGIKNYKGEDVIKPIYDDLQELSAELGLYLVKNSDKYGVIDLTGNTIIYPEYNKIGLDTTKFKDLENQYLLLDEYIPVMKNNKWGLYDKNGNKIVDIDKSSFDGFGCVPKSTIEKNANSIVQIKELDAIVVEENKKYGFINKNGEIVTPTQLDMVYSVSRDGEIYYYAEYEGSQILIYPK